MKAAFIYPNPRTDILRAWERGDAPDGPLLGQNHMAEAGIDAFVHDPALGGGGRVSWHLRELTLPWELGRADVAVTPLYRIFPPAARLRRGLKTVVLNYGFNVMLRHASRVRRSAEAAALHSPSRILCVAESQRMQLLELTRLRAERVEVLRLGTDAAFFAPTNGEPVEDDFVLAVGKDFARDYGTLVAALGRSDVRVHLACHPRNLVGVDLTETVTQALHEPSALRDLYARAACIVLPQHGDDHPHGTEGGGLSALLEAMAMAKPIVATDRMVIREYVTDGESALLVPPEDPELLRSAVERVLGDRNLARRLGAAARARIDNGLTTKHMALALAGTLHAVVDR